MSPNLSIVTKKSVKNKTRNFIKNAALFTVLTLASFYAGVFAPKEMPRAMSFFNETKTRIAEVYTHAITYRSAKKLIGRRSYSESKKLLEESKTNLTEGQRAELESLIQQFSPAALVKQADKEPNLQNKIGILRKAMQEYKATGQYSQEANKKYAEASLDGVVATVKPGESPSTIYFCIDYLIKDEFMFPNNKQSYVTREFLDLVVKAEEAYLSEVSKYDLDDCSSFVFATIMLAKKADQENAGSYTSRLIDAYAKMIKQILINSDSTVCGYELKALAELKRLESLTKVENKTGLNTDLVLIEKIKQIRSSGSL